MPNWSDDEGKYYCSTCGRFIGWELKFPLICDNCKKEEKPKKMGKPFTLYADNTLLKSLVCDSQAVLRQVLGYTTPDESLNLRCGLDCHSVLERHFKGASTDDAISALDDYSPWIENLIDGGALVQERFFAKNVERVMRAWLALNPVAKFPFETDPKLVEVGVVAPLTDEDTCVCGHLRDDHVAGSMGCEIDGCGCPRYCEVAFCGKLDMIGKLPGRDEELVPIDHKTTGSMNAMFARKFEIDSQLTGYIWLCEQHTGKKVRRAYVNAIEMGKLPDSDRKCPEHKIPYAECGDSHLKYRLLGPILRSEYAIKKWRRTALSLLDHYNRLHHARADRLTMKGVKVQGAFHDACYWCEFQRFCAEDQPTTAFSNGALIHEPWSPIDHVTGKRDVAKEKAKRVKEKVT